MKCTIKNMSPQTIAIFVRIDGRDGRVEIGPGKELIADHHETRIMKIYNKKGLILISPVVLGTISHQLVSITPDVAEMPKETSSDAKEIIESIRVPKSLQEIEEEVEQYVQDGYIKGEWTEEEVAFLRKNYPTKGRKFCSNKLNRNESSVQKKINSLSIKKKKKKK